MRNQKFAMNAATIQNTGTPKFYERIICKNGDVQLHILGFGLFGLGVFDVFGFAMLSVKFET